MEAEQKETLRNLLLQFKSEIAATLPDLVNTSEKVEALQSIDTVIMHMDTARSWEQAATIKEPINN